MMHRPPNPQRRTTGQGGYILATVLGLMIFSVLILSGLMAVTASTISLEETGRVKERQARAAEGAVEVAINQIRNDQLIASADPLNRKQPGESGYINGAPTHQQPLAQPGDAQYVAEEDPLINRAAKGGACDPVQELIEVDGFPVRVFCFNEELSSIDPDTSGVVSGIPEDDGAIAVRLVGDSYQGDPNPGSDHVTDLARTWRTSFPFNSSTISGFDTTTLNNTQGQLVFSGKYPMRIVGGLEVKRQVAAISSNNSSPALWVQGTARQGGGGVYGSGTGDLDCGIARPNPADTNNAPRADVVIDSNFVVADEGLRCNQADLKALSAVGTNPPTAWTNAAVKGWKYQNWDGVNGRKDSTNLKYDTMPTDCASYGAADPTRTAGGGAGIAVIYPGSYDARATKILNRMFRDCDNYTWYFERGNYWFDVYDPDAAASDPARHSLVFDNRTSDWVFGPMVEDAGITPGSRRPQLAKFPDQVCQRNGVSDGATITLSSRTGIHHEKGRVVVCGTTGPDRVNNTAIYQQPAKSLGARLVPGGITAGNFTPAIASNLHVTDGNRISTSINIPPTCWNTGECDSSSVAALARTFTATDLGIGAPNGANPGASPVSSVYVDVAGGGDLVTNPNQNRTSTTIEVKVRGANGGGLPTNPTCSMTYGPSSGESRRLPGNNTITSYDLLDTSVTGDCDTALNGVTRDRYYGATIKVTFSLNPPTLRNTQFDWLDWWPWLRDQVEAVCNAWNGWSLTDWLNNNLGFINWYATCDDRPQSVTYSVDSLALRLGWTPSFVLPVNASDVNATDCPNCIPFTSAADGIRYAADGFTRNTARAVASHPSNFSSSFGTSLSVLRYKVTDPTLADGFLPLEQIDFGYLIAHSGFSGTLDNDDNNIVMFTLKSPDGVWCRKSVRISQITSGVEKTALGTPLRPADGVVATDASNQVLQGCVRPRADAQGNFSRGMIYNRSNPSDPNNDPVVRYPEIGQFVTHYDDPAPTTNCSPVSACEVAANLDVEVLMSRRGVAKTVEVDYATMSATTGGYDRPSDPFTVTWNPMTPNNDGQPCCWDRGAVPSIPNEVGDATFNVWGSVSVPNNDVRVVWNWDTTRGRGPTGFPIFNSGDAVFARCNATHRDQCQPALVASALGSWTTTSTSGGPNSSAWPDLGTYSQPDPLASTGDTRPPFRKVRIHACVVDPDGGGQGGDLLPRAEAQVTIADRDANKKIQPGSRVWVTSWQSTRDPAYETGVDAMTNECDTPA